MALKQLLNKKMTELELFDRVAIELQKNFFLYHEGLLSVEISPVRDEFYSINKITHCLTEQEHKESEHYQFDGPFHKMCILAKYYNGFYKMTLFGRWVHKSGCIHYNNVTNIHFARFNDDQLKERVLYDLDFLKAAFGDITQELLNSNSPEPKKIKKFV